MLGTLLESRAHRHRRSGGMALSVIVHLAIITASVAGTTIATPAPRRREPMIVIVPPQPKTPEPKPVRTPRRESPASNNTNADLVIKQIEVPTKIPVGIPDIDIRGAVAPDSIVIGGGPGTKSGGIRGSLIGDDPSANSEWRGNDAYMNLIKSATPRYPEALRQAGVDGRVLIRFTVDTLGRIDPASVQVVTETHALFSRAVRDVIAQFRFRAAESNGKKVPALAEMPFEFSITKR
jgi:periplasmic protein TonB